MSYYAEFNESLARALVKDLPDVEFEARGEKRTRRPHDSEVEVYAFPQTWGSTSLGFGGIGGQAMTSALTVVVTEGRNGAVYFGGRLAYVVAGFNQKFWEDLRAHSMAEVGRQGSYFKRVS